MSQSETWGIHGDSSQRPWICDHSSFPPQGACFGLWKHGFAHSLYSYISIGSLQLHLKGISGHAQGYEGFIYMPTLLGCVFRVSL